MKAVILAGNRQFIVAEKEQILVDRINGKKAGETVEFEALALIDGAKTELKPGKKVAAKIVDELVKGEKTRAIRFHPKKRVKKIVGGRHEFTRVEIAKIA